MKVTLIHFLRLSLGSDLGLRLALASSSNPAVNSVVTPTQKILTDVYFINNFVISLILLSFVTLHPKIENVIFRFEKVDEK